MYEPRSLLQALTSTNGKLIMIQLTVPKQFSQEVLPVLDQILEV
jgi:hypothetical protein